MPLTKLKNRVWQPIPDWKTCPIDAVFTWVDLTDPQWQQQYEQTTGQPPPPHRYQSYDELSFGITSVQKYAPFVRTIFIVTDNQQPPDTIDFLTDPQIQLIDHHQILGPTCHRPTFKSTSIESYLHQIPNLSEVFLYFNDDMALGRHIQRIELFNPTLQIPVVELKPKNLSFRRLGPLAKQEVYFQKKPWERHLFNAAALIEKKFNRNPQLSYTHQMMVVRKSSCQQAWCLYASDLNQSVAQPTRVPNTHTISFIPLAQYLGILTGQLEWRRGKSPWKQRLLSQTQLATPTLAEKSFQQLLRDRPHLICINYLTPNTQPAYDQFRKKYFSQREQGKQIVRSSTGQGTVPSNSEGK